MSGGIQRWAYAARKIGSPDTTLVLIDGGLVEASGTQDRMKANTFSEAYGSIKHSLINIGASEAALGRDGLVNLANLSQGRLVSLSEAQGVDGVQTWQTVGPFLVSGLSSRKADETELQSKIQSFVAAANSKRLSAVLMTDDSFDDAQKLALRYPALRAVIYRSDGDPPTNPPMVGNCIMLTAGEHGKVLIRELFQAGKWFGYARIDLGPRVPNDPTVSRFYAAYLRTINAAHLLVGIPVRKSETFLGSDRCRSCHQSEYKVWQSSAHAHAYLTLNLQGHENDPDCVKCHVTGLGFETGFLATQKQPSLSSVGCESCHGPGGAHAENPRKNMVKIGEKSCISCHTPTNSPGFNFLTFWPRIIHGKRG